MSLTPEQTAKFIDLPLGTRFRYIDAGARFTDHVFVILEKHGSGLVADYADPDMRPAARQSMYSAAADYDECQSLIVEVVRDDDPALSRRPAAAAEVAAGQPAAEPELMPLPPRDGDWAGDDWFTADSMHAYARAHLRVAGQGKDSERLDAAAEHRSLILGQAVAHHGCKWPEQLWSGVMFFNGQRITKAEFEERAMKAGAQGGGKW